MDKKWWEVNDEAELLPIHIWNCKTGWSFDYSVNGTEFTKCEVKHFWANRILTNAEAANWSDGNCDCDICKAKSGPTRHQPDADEAPAGDAACVQTE